MRLVSLFQTILFVEFCSQLCRSIIAHGAIKVNLRIPGIRITHELSAAQYRVEDP